MTKKFMEMFKSRITGKKYIRDGNEYIDVNTKRRCPSLEFKNGELQYIGSKINP